MRRMSKTLCKLCLFKSEPLDEVLVEESQQLQLIIADLFQKTVTLSQVELNRICSQCREKLKSYHEYYKFVLENQKFYSEKLKLLYEVPAGAEEPKNPEFVVVFKNEPNVDDDLDTGCQNDEIDTETSDADNVKQPKRSKPKKRRVQKPRSHVLARQKQQSDLIATLFDFKCTFCGAEMTSYKEIINHCKALHKQPKVWKCCEKEMTRDIDLIEHVMNHKDHTWKCESCAIEFLNAQELWIHRSKKHSEPSKIAIQNPHDWLKLQFKCDICRKRFRTRGLIVQHMKDAHIRNFVCGICGAAFYDRVESAKHRKMEHSSILKVPCPICGVLIKNKISLVNSHIKNLHKNQSMVCPLCGKVCNNDRIYRTHMIRNHKPPKHKCQYCDKRFKAKVQLEDHEAIHTGVSRYICNICGAQFKSQGNYTAHRRKLHPVEHQKQKLEREAKRYKL